MRKITVRQIIIWGCSLLLLLSQAVTAAESSLAPDRIADVTNTKHNFSVDAPALLTGETRVVQAQNQKEVCVFCHTPHFANNDVAAPLWNRAVSSQTYTVYDSSSMDADMSASPQPGQSSKLCLSCHDGTLAIGSVNSAGGGADIQVDANGVITGINQTEILLQNSVTTMPGGQGADTGFTRDLGTDLSNDHPIGFSYDSSLASNDGELVDPATSTDIDSRVGRQAAGTGGQTKTHMAVPLENGRLECTSCHDPHIRGTNGDETKNIKFLRLNRFQKAVANESSFTIDTDMGCLACHRKQGWAFSAHAHPNVADERYSSAAAQLREFPEDTQVWEAGCLNCHDSHTVPGAPRLLREATDSNATPKQSGNAASEESCYQCHSPSGVLQDLTDVADVETEFSASVRMPIASLDQQAGTEVHAIANADFTESPALLGKASAGGSATNRHVECGDCHNPHRMIKNSLFNADASTPDASGTHEHGATGIHSNLASGVLRGTTGVEPTYASEAFTATPTGFTVKQGDPGVSVSTDVTEDFVTREYQVCLRCHSEYAFDTPPALGLHGNGTPTGSNGLTQYTDQAMEFQAPADHQGDVTSVTDPGVAPAYLANNHRSWHPVMDSTGRTAGQSAYLSPFDQGAGNQTMYCSDCHGSVTAPGTVVPTLGKTWGPHGSDNAFLLKGKWNTSTGAGQTDGLCFQCHDFDQYANSATSGAAAADSGFACTDSSCITAGDNGLFKNLHIYHATAAGGANTRCMDCHTAVPHGWKNKGLLVNLNDVGPEIGMAVGTLAPTYPYSQEPYYLGAKLTVNSFKSSGQWQKADCASSGCHLP